MSEDAESVPAQFSDRASTWVEKALVDAWGDVRPLPTINRAEDATAEQPGLIDFTILDLRIGAMVWADTMEAFVSHRLYCSDPFAGRLFEELVDEPLGSLTLPEFVRALGTHYPAILRNVPLADPLRDPDTAEDVAADEVWAEKRRRPAPITERFIGMLVALLFVAVATFFLIRRLSH